MAVLSAGQVGPAASFDGAQLPLRQGRAGELVVQEIHGRFYEQNYRGNLFSFGLSNTVLVAANAIATGLAASAQPVIALYNPLSSPVNLVILQATIVQTTIGATAVAPGGFMWVYSANNGAVTTGASGINGKTLLSNSNGKAMSISTALTGLTNSLAVLRGTSIAPFNAAGAATAVTLTQGASVENVDGSIIVPPGAVVGIMNQVSTITVNLTTGILWEEVPL